MQPAYNTLLNALGERPLEVQLLSPRAKRTRFMDLKAITARYEMIANYPIHVSGAYRDPKHPLPVLKSLRDKAQS